MKNEIIVLLSIAGSAAVSSASPANGGFETGTLASWNQNSGLWGGGSSYSYSGAYNNDTTIVTPGYDPVVAAAGGTLSQVYNGSYAVRVNDINSGYHFNTIAQTWTESDSVLNFEWAAVLQDPGHPHEYEPQFTINLVDLTTSTTIYSVNYAADTLPSGSFNSGTYAGETIRWTNWFVNTIDTSGVIGHQLSLTLNATDCGYGGHGGYVYMDAFANTILPPNPGVPPAITVPDTIATPEPSTVFLGMISIPFLFRRRRC